MSGAPRDVLLRKMACAVLPRAIRLSRTLPDGTIVGGPNRAGHGGRGVFIFGAELEPELRLLPHLVRPEDVVVDVGANSGLYSLSAARLVGRDGVVVSLEPNPAMLAVLDRNVRANGYTNVRLRGFAAADERAAFTLYEHKAMPNSFSIRDDDHGAVASTSILGIDLDTLLAWEGIERLALVKIDAEGVEDRVLAGAAASIARHRPVIIAEVTKNGLTAIPDGYVGHRPAHGRTNNSVLVPEEHAARRTLAEQGWVVCDVEGRNAITSNRGTGDEE